MFLNDSIKSTLRATFPVFKERGRKSLVSSVQENLSIFIFVELIRSDMIQHHKLDII